MKKLWQVARYEYTHHVLRRRFILGVLSVPLFIVAIVAVMFLAVVLQMNTKPAGYVDLSGRMRIPPSARQNGLFPAASLIAYPDEGQASADLESGKLAGYYVVEKDYFESGRVRLVAPKTVNQSIENAFENFLRANLVAGLDEAVARRLLENSTVEIRSPDGARQTDSRQWLQIVLPIASGILFVIAINASGGYLLQAVVEEKENRTMEIMVTSVSPTQLMGGKIIGNLSVGLTQLVIWLVFPVGGLIAARALLPDFGALRLDTGFLGLMLLTLLPAFVLVAALMATVGATATETREAQQIAGLFTLPIVVPLWFIAPIMMRPNAPLAFGLSLFPLTAPISLPLRAAVTEVPTWQLILSISLLVSSALAAILLAGRAFRLGMLRYGKRLTLRELLGRA